MLNQSIRIKNFDDVISKDPSIAKKAEHDLWKMGAFETYLKPVTELIYFEMGNTNEPSVQQVIEVLNTYGFESELI